LDEKSVVKNYFTTAADGKQYEVAFYALDMILAIGFRPRPTLGLRLIAVSLFNSIHSWFWPYGMAYRHAIGCLL